MSLLTAPMVGCGGDDSSGGNEGGAGGDGGAAGAAGATEPPPVVCGDGVRGLGEACDDGDTSDEGDCLGDCSGSTSCGDKVVQSNEDCDDGNDVNNDGCTNRCVAAANGDGIIQASLGEECDDGNRTNTDDCTNDGQNAECGDGIVQTGVEACDEGEATDECTAQCRVPTCGDGNVDAGEDCDDDNADNTDTCTNNCLDARCGDGFILDGVETCDDGSANADDAGCLSTCERAACGDGLVRTGVEACDEGGETDTCTADCASTSCGDGIVQSDEECDEGDDNADNASATCTMRCTVPACGDNIQQGDEECDDGNGVSTDGCIECVVARCGDGIVQTNVESCDEGGEASETCTATCVLATCGDGVVQAGEDCDDDNNVDTDGCSNSCFLPMCGDGIVNGDDVCDEGAANSDTGACLADCSAVAMCGDGLVQAGVEACDSEGVATADCTADCKSTDCGDGVLQPGEECDDGDANADTAAATCTTICTVPACGDGITQTGEACDDGNGSNLDECTNTCTVAVCGDGFVQAGESCDDGNATDNDGCSQCRPTTCGNGEVEAGEQCDDENNDDTDLCTNNCLLPTCGDGLVRVVAMDMNADGDKTDTVNNLAEAEEECDTGATGTNVVSGCTPYCKWNVCQDGFVQSAATNHNPSDDNDTKDTGEAAEACDDGNAVSNDACTNTCTVSTCGDGVRQAGEACDLGTCDPDEEETPGTTCNADEGNTACTTLCALPACGDGFVQDGALVTNDESCDDGNTIATDGCTATCEYAECGDKIVWADVETCDGTAGCQSDCALSTCGDKALQTATEECDATVTGTAAGTCTDSCFTNVCGDNFRGAGEECDWGPFTRDGVTAQGAIAAVAGVHDAYADDDPIVCTSACLVNVCGDKIVAGSEECDDGNDVNTDACHDDCTASKCGDKVVDAGEECDDGNGSDSDACTTACTLAECGDGYVQSYTTAAGLKVSEGCDDGGTAAINLSTGDICSPTCVPATCHAAGTAIVGDAAGVETGYWRYDEEGGLSQDCRVNDLLLLCTGAAGGCAACVAGDDADEDATNGLQVNEGTVAVPVYRTYWLIAETCDDNNEVNTDGCKNACQDSVCGDGVEAAAHVAVPAQGIEALVTAEECDDGNDSNADACVNTCEDATCGDGYINESGPADLNDDTKYTSAGERAADMEECDLGEGNGTVTAGAADLNSFCSAGCLKMCSTALADGIILDTDADGENADDDPYSEAELAEWDDNTARNECYISMGAATFGGEALGNGGAPEAICPAGSTRINVDSADEFEDVLQGILGNPAVDSTGAWIDCPANNTVYTAWDSVGGEPSPAPTLDTFTGAYTWGTTQCHAFQHNTRGWRWYSVANTDTSLRTFVCEYGDQAGDWEESAD